MFRVDVHVLRTEHDGYDYNNNDDNEEENDDGDDKLKAVVES